MVHARDVAKTRNRRTAEAARDEILRVAERRLIESGPDALRLQDIAADVGVSHPAILHHFGSRDKLVLAVVDHAIARLQDDLVKALEVVPVDGVALFERVHDTLATHGHGRLIGWLLLVGHDPFAGRAVRAKWRQIIETTHAARVQFARGGAPPSYEDTAFLITLAALALLGLSLAGVSTFALAGLPTGAKTEQRFRARISGVIGAALSQGS